jgi:hypothetical protein
MFDISKQPKEAIDVSDYKVRNKGEAVKAIKFY